MGGGEEIPNLMGNTEKMSKLYQILVMFLTRIKIKQVRRGNAIKELSSKS